MSYVNETGSISLSYDSIAGVCSRLWSTFYSRRISRLSTRFLRIERRRQIIAILCYDGGRAKKKKENSRKTQGYLRIRTLRAEQESRKEDTRESRRQRDEGRKVRREKNQDAGSIEREKKRPTEKRFQIVPRQQRQKNAFEESSLRADQIK